MTFGCGQGSPVIKGQLASQQKVDEALRDVWHFTWLGRNAPARVLELGLGECSSPDNPLVSTLSSPSPRHPGCPLLQPRALSPWRFSHSIASHGSPAPWRRVSVARLIVCTECTKAGLAEGVPGRRRDEEGSPWLRWLASPSLVWR